MLKISEKIQTSVEDKLKTSQREYYLRQQLKAIQSELSALPGKEGAAGEKDEVAQLEERLAQARQMSACSSTNRHSNARHVVASRRPLCRPRHERLFKHQPPL